MPKGVKQDEPEIRIMKAMARDFSTLDGSTRRRVLEWAWSRWAETPPPGVDEVVSRLESFSDVELRMTASRLRETVGAGSSAARLVERVLEQRTGGPVKGG